MGLNASGMLLGIHLVERFNVCMTIRCVSFSGRTRTLSTTGEFLRNVPDCSHLVHV